MEDPVSLYHLPHEIHSSSSTTPLVSLISCLIFNRYGYMLSLRSGVCILLAGERDMASRQAKTPTCLFCDQCKVVLILESHTTVGEFPEQTEFYV